MNVPLMFPAEIDRFRLLQLIAWWGRKNAQLEQKPLAFRARVHQTSVSHLEHLEDAARLPPDIDIDPEKRKRLRLGRESLIKIFSWGLQFPRADIDAMLWLYGEQSLTCRDIEDFVKKYEPDAKPQHYTEQDYDRLRHRVLKLLRQVRDYLLRNNRTDNGSHSAAVKLIFEGTEKEYLASEKELLRVEGEPGQRMMLTKHPSFLTYPLAEVGSGELIEPWITEPTRGQVLQLNLERQETFLRHLEFYGERGIHRMASLRTYLSETYKESTPHRPLEKRRTQIENLIKLLETYPHFEIRISQETPEFEFTIKSVAEVIMRGTSHGDRDDSQLRETNILVPRYIHWTDPLSMLSYYLTFEMHWDSIPKKDRTKETVIAKLEQLLL